MVSEDERIYVRTASWIHTIGSGYSSSVEVEEHIERVFGPGEYEYGVFETCGSHVVEAETPETRTLTEVEKGRLKTIEKNANSDSRVVSFDEINDHSQTYMGSLHANLVRYDNGEVDFSMKVANDEFDDVPVSTIDLSVEEKLRGIFNDVSGDMATFLGYNSTYASRGRRNPYIRVYGRVHRDSPRESQLRDIASSSRVAGLYWTESNISPVRVHIQEPRDENYNKNDYVLVLNAQNDIDSFREFGDNAKERAIEAAEEIESEYDYRVPWKGLTVCNSADLHVCLGLAFIDG